MELTVREWMVLVGLLLILAILLDGYRRMRHDRSDKVRVSLVKVPEDTSDPDHLISAHELPAGGARVIERSGYEEGEQDQEFPVSSHSADEKENVGKMAPLDETELFVSSVLSADTQKLTGETIALFESDMISATPPREVAKKDTREVIILNVLARNGEGFGGSDLLEILLACDLRFGKANLFHRHEQTNGRGPIQFSVASVVNPGIFDIDDMDDFFTPGVTLFVSLPGPEKSMQAFDYMLETAQVLANNLEGDILDEAHSVITKQTIEHCRQRISDFERKILAKISS